MTESPPPGAAGATWGLLDRVLRYVDRPWKIVAVIILAAATGLGLAAWERRAELAEAILERWVEPRLYPERFQKIAARLLADTNTDLVVLASVSLRSNLLRNLDGFRRNKPDWIPAVNPRPLYGMIRDPVRLVSFIEGRVVCHDVDPADGEEERAEAALGIKRRCFVAVPPVLDAPIGALAIGWTQPVSAEAETGAMSLLWQAATELATW